MSSALFKIILVKLLLFLINILPSTAFSSFYVILSEVENGYCEHSGNHISIESLSIECPGSGSSYDDKCSLSFGRLVKLSGTISYDRINSQNIVVSVVLKDTQSNQSYSVAENAKVNICNSDLQDCLEKGSSDFAVSAFVPSYLKDSFIGAQLVEFDVTFSNIDDNSILSCSKITAKLKPKAFSVKGYFTYYAMCSIVSGAGLLCTFLCALKAHQTKRKIASLDDSKFITNKVNLQRCGDKEIEEIIPDEWYDTIDDRDNYV